MSHTIRTPEKRADLLEAISSGLSDTAACDAAGISRSAFYSWIEADGRFGAAIQQARTEYKRALQVCIVRASERDWRAAAWLLSHRFPEEYSERRVIALAVAEEVESPLDRFFRRDLEEREPAQAVLPARGPS